MSSVTVDRIELPAPPPLVRIQIELDEKTAEVLCSLIGGIHYHDSKNGSPGLLTELWRSLDVKLPNRKDSFRDFFVGGVGYK